MFLGIEVYNSYESMKCNCRRRQWYGIIKENDGSAEKMCEDMTLKTGGIWFATKYIFIASCAESHYTKKGHCVFRCVPVAI